MTKKPINIDRLLTCTFLEELPKGQRLDKDIGSIILGTMKGRHQIARTLSAPKTEAGPNGWAAGTPHPDAFLVRDAVDELPRAVALASEADALRQFGWYAPLAGPYLADLLDIVIDQHSLIVRQAIAGTPPVWVFDTPTPSQATQTVKNARGQYRSKGLVEGLADNGKLVPLPRNRGKAAMTQGAYDLRREPRSPLVWSPSPLIVGRARLEYSVWHHGLCFLVKRLSGTLSEYEPTVPISPAFPWLADTKQGRLLRRTA